MPGVPGVDFAVIRCVDWLQRRGLEVNQELWDGVYEIAQTAKRASVRLKARQMFLDRLDPIPKTAVDVHAPTTVNIAIIPGANDHALRGSSPDSGTIRIVSGQGNGA